MKLFENGYPFSPEINEYISLTYPVNMADIINLVRNLPATAVLTIIAVEFPYEAAQIYFHRQCFIKAEGLD